MTKERKLKEFVAFCDIFDLSLMGNSIFYASSTSESKIYENWNSCHRI